MNDLGSGELKPLDAIRSLRLWMIGKVLGHELKALYAMKDSRL